MRRLFALVPVVSLLLVACGGGGEESEPDPVAAFDQPYENVSAYPQFASSDLAVGENRFLIGLLNQNDAPVGSPDIEVNVDFYDLEESATEPVASKEPTFLWSIKPLVGLYATNVEFDSAGKWGAEVDIVGEGFDETLKGSFTVAEQPSTPALGSQAPASDNPTADDVKKLSAISTDKSPDPRFYQTTIKKALSAGEPFVAIFATPKFCQTQTCGPMLDIVKDVAKDFPKLTFIHIEPYELPADPSSLQGTPAATEWGLPTEPWAFVVDAKGKVVAKYEGALSAQELRSELEGL